MGGGGVVFTGVGREGFVEGGSGDMGLGLVLRIWTRGEGPGADVHEVGMLRLQGMRLHV